MKKQSLAIAMSAALLAPVSALAQGWYAGGGIGDTELEDWGSSETSYKLYGGYRLSERLALELSYTDYGDFNEGQVRADADALAVTAVGMLPLNQQWGLFARGGVARTSTDVRFRSYHDSDEDFTFVVALGVSWLVAPQVELRAEYELLDEVSFGDAEDSNIETIGIGAAYRF